jgi:hypothetical protein
MTEVVHRVEQGTEMEAEYTSPQKVDTSNLYDIPNRASLCSPFQMSGKLDNMSDIASSTWSRFDREIQIVEELTIKVLVIDPKTKQITKGQIKAKSDFDTKIKEMTGEKPFIAILQK